MIEIKFHDWNINIGLDVFIRLENPELVTKLVALDARLDADRKKMSDAQTAVVDTPPTT